jgi:uncharacterized protein
VITFDGMTTEIEHIISQKLDLSRSNTASTMKLLSEGATIPFISRYRKEVTGNLDEVAVENIQTELKKLLELEKRKTTVLDTIREQGLLTDALASKIKETWDATTLEDLYLPFKPKRKTKATTAKENGLEPLAKIIIKQRERQIENRAFQFVKGSIESVEDALQGARDIIAEWISESPIARDRVRQIFGREAFITSKMAKGKKEEGQKFRDYFKFSEPLKKSPSHRILAMRRGESEGMLKLTIQPDAENVLHALGRIFIQSSGEAADQIEQAMKDSYKRLLGSSIETEFKKSSKEKADQEAIDVFAENLKQLLLAPPLGPKQMIAIDPGFRTGCKVVVLDHTGKLLTNTSIFPHPPVNRVDEASSKIKELIHRYRPEVIAIGNATAGRETETFVTSILNPGEKIEVFMVNESGASVYSASEIAREEFPNFDVTVRGAVSIGRRLMDPLAELVKIDPKAIGVGQYQHDVNQSLLKERLDRVVESCVNLVGVNLNTASKHLLAYVSGIGPKLAEKIVAWRDTNGIFQNRKQLMDVPGLGAKAFEQAAGFLRISESKNPLDKSAVHPESYHIVQNMSRDIGCSLSDIVQNDSLINQIDITKYTSETTGLPTLRDILSELRKPGRDPRGAAKAFSFDPRVKTIEDLQVGMILPGLVTNITRFGVFVDVGAKQDGLVHISHLANRFVQNPADEVKLGQEVQVKVLEVDQSRNRINLSIKEAG